MLRLRSALPWIISVFAALLFLLPAQAEEGLIPASSENVFGWEYSTDRHSYYGWATARDSYLVPGEDETLFRVEPKQSFPKSMLVEKYDRSFHLLSARELPWELDKFGAFFAGEDGYYLLFGQVNREHDDSLEVIRVVKYSRDWERLGAASFCGGNIADPFDVGRSRFAEKDGILYLFTSRDTNPGESGSQQTGLLLAIREKDMTVIWSSASLTPGEPGCVIKSYDQFILTAENGDLLTLEMSPGSISPSVWGGLILTRYPGAAGAEDPGTPQQRVLRSLPTDSNTTGVSLGGFEESSSCYLAVMNADGTNSSSAFRDIAVCAIDKQTLSNEIIWLTDGYSGDWEAGGCSVPHLVKFSGDRFLVIWETASAAQYSVTDSRLYLSYNPEIRYVWLDGSGTPVGEVRSAEGYLSDCVPLPLDGKAVWYVTADCDPLFYSLDPDGITSGTWHEPYPLVPEMFTDFDPETLEYTDRNTYDGSPITLDLTVRDRERQRSLYKGLDYTTEYANNDAPGIATVTVTGQGHYTGSLTFSFNIYRDYLSGGYVTLKETSFAYTGEEIFPEITSVVTVNGTVLTPEDYTVWYDSNKESGIGAVVVDASEDNLVYGQAFARFEILPPGETPSEPEARAGMSNVRAEYLFDRYVNAYGTLLGTLGSDAFLLGAVYDEEGRLLTVTRRDWVSYQDHQFSLRMTAENAASVQIFILDNNCRPLCASKKLPLTPE